MLHESKEVAVILYLLTAEGTGNVTVRRTSVSILRERENDAMKILFLSIQNTLHQKANRGSGCIGESYRPVEIFDDRNCLRVQSVHLGLDGESFCYEWGRHSQQWECKEDSAVYTDSHWIYLSSA